MRDVKNLIKKWRLWRWDVAHGGTLNLAERIQMIHIANNRKSERLDIIIKRLRTERAALSQWEAMT